MWRPDDAGPSVVAVRDGALFDVSRAFPTMHDLCEATDPPAALCAAGEWIGLANTPVEQRNGAQPWLLAPIDLHAIKVAGVTFVVSMIERVIEERARGDLNAAAAIRAEVSRLVGDDLARLEPGSAESAHLKQVLIERTCGASTLRSVSVLMPRSSAGCSRWPRWARGGCRDLSEHVVEQSRTRRRAGGLVGRPHRRRHAGQ